MSRQEDIANFFDGDRIWPPVISDERNRFTAALTEVLTRLPDDAFDIVSDCVSFVLAEQGFLAVNVPFERKYPPIKNGLTLRFDRIVFFEQSLGLANRPLVGLIAHELAHSVQSFPDYAQDEREADQLAISWGFSDELQSFREGKKALLSSQAKEKRSR